MHIFYFLLIYTTTVPFLTPPPFCSLQTIPLLLSGCIFSANFSCPSFEPELFLPCILFIYLLSTFHEHRYMYKCNLHFVSLCHVSVLWTCLYEMSVCVWTCIYEMSMYVWTCIYETPLCVWICLWNYLCASYAFFFPIPFFKICFVFRCLFSGEREQERVWIWVGKEVGRIWEDLGEGKL